MTVLVSVTQSDIDAARERVRAYDAAIAGGEVPGPGHPDYYSAPLHCPVSRAASRVLGARVSSGGGFIRLLSDHLSTDVYYVVDPRSMETWQDQFDSYGTGSPFEFELKKSDL